MKTFDVGTAVYIKTSLTDKNGALFDPTSVLVTVLDPTGAAKVTDAAMTKLSTGVYDYTYQSAENDALGNYDVKIKAASGAYTSISKVKLFSLE